MAGLGCGASRTPIIDGTVPACCAECISAQTSVVVLDQCGHATAADDFELDAIVVVAAAAELALVVVLVVHLVTLPWRHAHQLRPATGTARDDRACARGERLGGRRSRQRRRRRGCR